MLQYASIIISTHSNALIRNCVGTCDVNKPLIPTEGFKLDHNVRTNQLQSSIPLLQ